jgi:hypothetical protein
MHQTGRFGRAPCTSRRFGLKWQPRKPQMRGSYATQGVCTRVGDNLEQNPTYLEGRARRARVGTEWAREEQEWEQSGRGKSKSGNRVGARRRRLAHMLAGTSGKMVANSTHQ